MVLAIAKELQRQINGMRGFRAELTRTGEHFVFVIEAYVARAADQVRTVFAVSQPARRLLRRE